MSSRVAGGIGALNNVGCCGNVRAASDRLFMRGCDRCMRYDRSELVGEELE
jgi:hypothetical protein